MDSDQSQLERVQPKVQPPLVMAHRGNSAHAPENTMPAFEQAVQMGVDVLETDVHWTKDGVIVVSHDADVARVSDGEGLIEDLTWQQLSQLDFGYRFTPDRGKTYPWRGLGVRILQLRELLTAFPTMRFNIDIKPKSPQSLAQFIEELTAADAMHRVLVASFHRRVLKQFRKAWPHFPTSASPMETARLVAGSFLPGVAPVKPHYVAVQIPLRWKRWTVAQPRLIRAAHRRHLDVHVWTVDDPAWMMKLREIGVDGIFTNEPAAAMEVFGRTSLRREHP